MVFLISLVIALVFALLCDKAIKKHPYIFYIGAAAVAIFFAIFDFADVRGFAKDYILAIFQKGAFATALFVIVMFTGALKNASYLIKKLMPIRADLSIMASILILIHNVTYGKTYFVRLFSAAGSMPTTQLIAAVLSVTMLVIMIPLAVMSFKPIHRKMNGKLWKRIQRSAYVFYGLIYAHVMLINLPLAQRGNITYIINIIIYSIVFIGYTIIRIRKAVLKKQKNSVKAVNISFGSAGVVLMAAACAMIFVPYSQNMKNIGETAVYMALPENSSNTEISADTEEGVSDIASMLELEGESTNKSLPESHTTEESSEQGRTESHNSEQLSKQTYSNIEASTAEHSLTQQSSVSNRSSSSNKPSENSKPSVITSKPSVSSKPTTSSASSQTVREESNKRPESSLKPASTIYKDGTYSAKRYGYDGNVYATIVIKNDEIVSITATSEESDLWYFDQANQQVVPAIINRQRTDVDAVSGATYSSNAIMGAVEDALKKAKN